MTNGGSLRSQRHLMTNQLQLQTLDDGENLGPLGNSYGPTAPRFSLGRVMK
jgi:hypothetical protein